MQIYSSSSLLLLTYNPESEISNVLLHSTPDALSSSVLPTKQTQVQLTLVVGIEKTDMQDTSSRQLPHRQEAYALQTNGKESVLVVGKEEEEEEEEIHRATQALKGIDL